MTKTFKEYRKNKSKLPAMETCFGKCDVSEEVSKLLADLDQDKIHKEHAPLRKLPHNTGPISDYTKFSAETNSALHEHYDTPKNDWIASEKDHIKKLDDTLDANKTEKDMHVYTGLRDSPSRHFKDHTKTTEVHLPAYTSTSTDAPTAADFSRFSRHKNDKNHGIETEENTHVLKLHVPAGTHGASVRDISNHRRENEILLHRGLNIKIHPKPELHRGSRGNIYLWNAEVTGHNPQKI